METTAREPATLRDRLALALRTSMKARDQVALSALRSTLAALANAEAVGVGAAEPQPSGSADVAGSTLGVGATEAARRALADREVVDLVVAEATEREAAAREYAAAGESERATRLLAEAAVIRSHLG